MTSSCMLLLNKAVATFVHDRFSLILVQSVTSVLLNFLGTSVGIFRELKPFTVDMFRLFLPPSLIFFCMLLTSLISLPQVSVATVLVARSVGLCFVAMGEYFLFSNAKDTAQKVGLAIILVGAGIYGATDITYAAQGYSWLCINSLLNITCQLWEKRAICKAVNQTAEGLAIVQNTLVIPIALSMLLYTKETPVKTIATAPTSIQLFVFLSTTLGFLINLSYVRVNLSFQVTSIAVGSSLSRVVALLIGSKLFGEAMTEIQIFGASVCLFGSAVYSSVPVKFALPVTLVALVAVLGMQIYRLPYSLSTDLAFRVVEEGNETVVFDPAMQSPPCEWSKLDSLDVTLGRFPQKYCFMPPRGRASQGFLEGPLSKVACCSGQKEANVCFDEFWTHDRCCKDAEASRQSELEALSCAKKMRRALAQCMLDERSLGGCKHQGDACQCPAIMFNAQASAHKVNELSNDFNRVLWCLTGFNTTYVIDHFMAQGHTAHVLAHGLRAHGGHWQLGGFEMQAHLSQNAADSLRTFGSVVHTTSEQCTQIQARSGQQSLVITGKAPRTPEEAPCLQLLCPRDADLVVLDPDYQVLMQEELLLLERLCHPRMYAVNNVNLAAHGGWIKEYLLNLDFVEVARGSSPDFNAQANADAGKGNLSRKGNL
ncbi:GONST2 [Symbiodinium necroappetens]|uniref:GONST2 protein n=1 Tax=Symbiodinium necroappetens TaxID=1628268 RepID=A0A812QV50_9DINO|nr:GONST2 [Symbiodinium necroappetens]